MTDSSHSWAPTRVPLSPVSAVCEWLAYGARKSKRDVHLAKRTPVDFMEAARRASSIPHR